MKTKLWSSSYGPVKLEMTLEQANSVSHSGDCLQDVRDLISNLDNQLNKIDPKALVKVLKEYGTWDSDQLSNHSNNIERLVWIAGNDIRDKEGE